MTKSETWSLKSILQASGKIKITRGIESELLQVWTTDCPDTGSSCPFQGGQWWSNSVEQRFVLWGNGQIWAIDV